MIKFVVSGAWLLGTIVFSGIVWILTSQIAHSILGTDVIGRRLIEQRDFGELNTIGAYSMKRASSKEFEDTPVVVEMFRSHPQGGASLSINYPANVAFLLLPPIPTGMICNLSRVAGFAKMEHIKQIERDHDVVNLARPDKPVLASVVKVSGIETPYGTYLECPVQWHVEVESFTSEAFLVSVPPDGKSMSDDLLKSTFAMPLRFRWNKIAGSTELLQQPRDNREAGELTVDLKPNQGALFRTVWEELVEKRDEFLVLIGVFSALAGSCVIEFVKSLFALGSDEAT
jgi:hypothetical protein